MGRRIPNRSKFERFLRHYGVARMAAQLQIDESACYHWLRGVTRPKPGFAADIQRIAREQGSSLTLDDIYGHARKLRAVCPNVTIRDRLHELDPERGEASIYRTRDLVPSHLMPLLTQGKVVVTNWHVFEPQSVQVSGIGSKVTKAGVPVRTRETITICLYSHL